MPTHVCIVQEIEISDTLPVTAFGCAIPHIEPRYVKVTPTAMSSYLPSMGGVYAGNLNCHGLILTREMPRRQYGRHVVKRGPVKVVLCQVLRA